MAEGQGQCVGGRFVCTVGPRSRECQEGAEAGTEVIPGSLEGLSEGLLVWKLNLILSTAARGRRHRGRGGYDGVQEGEGPGVDLGGFQSDCGPPTPPPPAAGRVSRGAFCSAGLLEPLAPESLL